MHLFRTAESLVRAKGIDLGVTQWRRIERAQVVAFHAATLPANAQGLINSPTIVPHSMLVPLIPSMRQELWRFENHRAAINYGLNAIRYGRPVPLDSPVRLRAVLVDVSSQGDTVMISVDHTIEVGEAGSAACRALGLTQIRF